MLAEDVVRIKEWFARKRFDGIIRLYSAKQVAEQRGAIRSGYPVAERYAGEFYDRLRELFAAKKSITTFGPYSPGQAVAMKRMGIEGIYLGGWATSAKGSIDEDPGPDLASYPLSQVPNEAASIVRALLTADKNQFFARSRMSDQDRKTEPEADFRPFIIADADTGHGGDAHVRNLIRRFVEVGVTGYHIEDQKPGCKKCGHQGGKVLVPQDEQIKRLNAARFQLDLMQVPGIIVARTDAEAATLIDGRGDERDYPFVLGATNSGLPPYKVGSLYLLKYLYENGITDVNGHLLYCLTEDVYERVVGWFAKKGITAFMDGQIEILKKGTFADVESAVNTISNQFHNTWESEAGLKTFPEAVADVMEFQIEEGSHFELTAEEWKEYANSVSFPEARSKARSMGINIIWDAELPKTPEGYYLVQGGIRYAIARSLACAPFADLLWMETKTANLADAKKFADAIHAVYPDQMLAYNLSPSFNWDTTGMSEKEMREFPEELGKLGYVFNFITYGGHQIDGLASEDFATLLRRDGMLALASLQRQLRLTESPYKTPQTLVGGSRVDAALGACSGRTAATKAMGKGSTQFQHLVQTELPPKVLKDWIAVWAQRYNIAGQFGVSLKPHRPGSELLKLEVTNEAYDIVADIVFLPITDRKENSILSVRDQNTYKFEYRRKRLMLLLHLFLIARYKAAVVHYVSPSVDNKIQTEKMKFFGIYSELISEVGQIIVAEINQSRIDQLLDGNAINTEEIFK